MRKEISQFLQTSQDPIARIRVEHVIREINMQAAYDILELFCEFVYARVPILETQRDCPQNCEAIASIIFACSRMFSYRNCCRLGTCLPQSMERSSFQVLVADMDKLSHPLAEPWEELVHLVQEKGQFMRGMLFAIARYLGLDPCILTIRSTSFPVPHISSIQNGMQLCFGLISQPIVKLEPLGIFVDTSIAKK
ncbi:hypothetical protein IFM89_039980 [Coptis chinensis]|uniref:Uncharacterized protein n=1 Tax=Coptis chinensis TaxID=261450 RepID=A0A835GSF2_9MAGN|nr:hypothetical protein IFM89_039980 [Coptis chinensis]